MESFLDKEYKKECEKLHGKEVCAIFVLAVQVKQI